MNAMIRTGGDPVPAPIDGPFLANMPIMLNLVTDLGDVSPGDDVVIIGAQGDESWQQLDVREMASAIGTIPYEIVCRIGSRIERQYDGRTTEGA